MDKFNVLAVKFMQVIQFLFIIQEKPAAWIYSHTNEKLRHKMRISLLAGLNIYMICMDLSGIYSNKNYYKYQMLLTCVLLLAVGWLLYEGKLEYQKWKSSFFTSWFIYWIAVCICDALMGSTYILTGYIMLLVMGSIFFFWGNQKSDKKIFLQEIFISMGIGMIFYIAALFIKKPMLCGIQEFKDMTASWIKELNLLGHKKAFKNADGFLNGYNSIMEIMYRYGVWIVVPYISLWIHTLLEGLRCRKELIGIVFLEIIFSAFWFCFNIEKPFLVPIWTAYYLHMGFFIVNDSYVKER